MYYPREAARDHLFNRAALLFFLILLACVFAMMSREDGLRYAALQTSAKEVTGTVTQVEELWRGPVFLGQYVHYRFDDRNTRGDGVLYQDTFTPSGSYHEGEPVQVVYSEWFPSYHNLATQLRFGRPGFYIFSASVATVVLGFGLLFWTTHLIFRHRQEDRYY
ncbi:hypothetical protein [Pseudomonas gingeri]